MKTTRNPRRSEYIRNLFAPETPQLALIRKEFDDNISIHAEEGKLLQLLIGLIGARKIVEIGTFGGYSTLWMAGALPPEGHIWTIEKDKGRAETARKNLQHDSRVTLIEGDATEALETLQGPFDMIFIDADKVNYLHYLDWAEKNVRPGGLIIGDNTFLFDAILTDEPVERVRETAREAMRSFNCRLANPARYRSIMLDTPEGMTIAQRLL
jgi:predicted O-methyltransferase YrrM